MNISRLKGKIPDKVFEKLPVVIANFGIDTPQRLAHFLAQCKCETGLTKVRESFNYAPERLIAVFPGKFKKNPAKAYELVKQGAQAIANCIYALKELGNREPNDGFYFMGRSHIGITGRDLYTRLNKAKVFPENIVANPDLLATKYPLEAAAWYFQTFCLKYADLPPTYENSLRLTKSVNKGLLGKQERWDYFEEFQKLITI